MIPVYPKRPDHKSRYQPGDIVATNRKAYGTLTRYGTQAPLKLPAGLRGSVMEVSPFKNNEGYPPTWIYRIRFPATGEDKSGEDKYWVRGGMLVLIERNPALKRQQPKRKTIRRTL